MSASPGPVAVTTPDAETVATVATDDCQLDCAVTFSVVPSVKVAVATNCDDAPGAGGCPLTITALTFRFDGAPGVDVELWPHASVTRAQLKSVAEAPRHWKAQRYRFSFCAPSVTAWQSRRGSCRAIADICAEESQTPYRPNLCIEELFPNAAPAGHR